MEMTLLRIIHIALGVFWAGAVFFLVLFLAPAIRRVGPDGGRVLAEIDRARFLEIMPVAALITIASGLWMMWLESNGFAAAFFGSRRGLWLTIGGVAAILGLLVGVLVMRPATKRLLQIGPLMAAAQSDEERQLLGAEVPALQRRSRTSSVWVAILLLVAVLGMAVSRYV